MTCRFLLLGTGTSSGVPVLGCGCRVCASDDPRDKRLRQAAMMEADGGNILIDCGTDIREQLLRVNQPKVGAVLITHQHSDHISGLAELRPLAKCGKLDVFCSRDVAECVRARNRGCDAFVNLNVVEPGDVRTICGVEVRFHWCWHGKLKILCFRCGGGGYITDCSQMPEETLEGFRGVQVLVINSLSLKTHPTHMSFDESAEVIRCIGPSSAYIVHLTHDCTHVEAESFFSGVSSAIYVGYDLQYTNKFSP